jgi:hypothetical protein
MDNGAGDAYKRALLESLRTIRRTHQQLEVAAGRRTNATPTALASQMELYGVLLGEVAGIRRNLVAYLECARTSRWPNSDASGMH